MSRDLDKRLKSLEAKAGQAEREVGRIILAEWQRCYAAGTTPDYPDTVERCAWVEKMQPIWDAGEEIMAVFEDELIRRA